MLKGLSSLLHKLSDYRHELDKSLTELMQADSAKGLRSVHIGSPLCYLFFIQLVSLSGLEHLHFYLLRNIGEVAMVKALVPIPFPRLSRLQVVADRHTLPVLTQLVPSVRQLRLTLAPGDAPWLSSFAKLRNLVSFTLVLFGRVDLHSRLLRELSSIEALEAIELQTSIAGSSRLVGSNALEWLRGFPRLRRLVVHEHTLIIMT
jgi:hypothetical protein